MFVFKSEENYSFKKLRTTLDQVYNDSRQNFDGYTNLIEWILELDDCFDNQEDHDTFKQFLSNINSDLSSNNCDMLTGYIDDLLKKLTEGIVTDKILKWISMKPCSDESADCFSSALYNRKDIFKLFNIHTQFKEFSKEKLIEHTEIIKSCIPLLKNYDEKFLDFSMKVKNFTNSFIYAYSNAVRYFQSDSGVQEILNDCYNELCNNHSFEDLCKIHSNEECCHYLCIFLGIDYEYD